MQLTKKQLILAHRMTTFLTITGGILFTVGSIVFLPSLANSVSPYAGGVLFIVGSGCYFLCDIIGIFSEPQFTPFKPFNNVGSLRSLMMMIGNLSFIIGSLFFLPYWKVIVGDDIFIIASVFVSIPQIITCFGLYSHQGYNEKFYLKLKPIKKQILAASFMLGIACFMFFIGTVLFKNQQSQSQALYIEGVYLFIIGSALFLSVALLGAYLRHKTPREQPNQIEVLIELTTFRP